MATAPSPNDLTRQQLDELDALLQRMLSVPLTPPDTPAPVTTPAPAPPTRGSSDTASAPPLPPSWRVDPPATAAGASAPHIALPEPPSSVALKLEPPPPAPASAATPPVQEPVPKPAAPPAPKTPPAPAKVVVPPAPVAPLPAPPAVAVTPVPATPPVPLPLVPLVALNTLFDGVCGMFGPLGRLLRSGFFKYLYGLTGLGLIVYTAAHVAQVQGWLSLPVSLPWPR